jgi:crotonobetainyl-CoA:carnitine CoA-transferase CaiB-like acyl-CoA transferase
VTVIERTHTVAGSYTARLLAGLGASVVLVEPPGGHALRWEPPLLPGSVTSSIFAYLAAGKASVVCDVATDAGRGSIAALIGRADVYVDDFDGRERSNARLDSEQLSTRFQRLVQVAVRPFGSAGPKAGWTAEEIVLFHASGEGSLLPNGLAAEMHPDRPPLKAFGFFAEYQGGLAAALAVLAALWSGHGETIDVSVQDAAICVGAFNVQRYGDGAIETRQSRSFRYGGVLACADGHVEILALEDRQWLALAELVGRTDWLADPELADAVGRSEHGAAINEYLRAWARDRRTLDIVSRAQRLGIPAAQYNSPASVIAGEHEKQRQVFQSVDVPGAGRMPMLRAPFHFDGAPLDLRGGVPEQGSHQHLLIAALEAPDAPDRAAS